MSRKRAAGGLRRRLKVEIATRITIEIAKELSAPRVSFSRMAGRMIAALCVRRQPTNGAKASGLHTQARVALMPLCHSLTKY